MKDDEVKVLIDRINNNEAIIKNEIIPIMEESLTIDGLPFRKYDLLGFACELIDKNKLDEAENLLKMILGIYGNKHGSVTFERICNAIYDLIIYEEMRKNEIYYQQIFKNHCKEIMGDGYELYDMKNQKTKRPDAWVKFNNIIMPVEMKKGKFGENALKQLQGYMDLYNCNFGIAIGLRSAIKFPDNIRFIDIAEVKRYDN